MECVRVKDAFAKLSLSADVLQKLGGASVGGIRVNRGSRQMRISLTLARPVGDSVVCDFQREIQEHFPKISQVEVEVRCDAPVIPEPPLPAAPIAERKPKYNGKSKGTSLKINPGLSKQTNAVKALSEPIERDEKLIVAGEIFYIDLRDIKDNRLLVSFDLTDGANALTIKFFCAKDVFASSFQEIIKPKKYVYVKGKAQYDEYAHEVNMLAEEIAEAEKPICFKPQRADNAKDKRVELHLHTQMSAMDGVTAVKDIIKRAISWGHPAVAITDHGVVQAFPEAMDAAKGSDLKVIYGVEAYLVNDLGATVRCPGDKTLNETFVVFDLETTGLHKETDRIIEIGAVKIQDGQITQKFSAFVQPKIPLPSEITKLTGIKDAMLADAQDISDVLPRFLEFTQNAVLVAHNASFDVGFVTEAARTQLPQPIEIANTVLDTLELTRGLFTELPKHKLDVVAKHLGVSLDNHHRAVDDATATAEIFLKCREILVSRGVQSLSEINMMIGASIDPKKSRYFHAVILARNATGLRHLYELISQSHMDTFYKKPRIPKSKFLALREGLLIGTACDAGEFYIAVKENAPDEYIRELAAFYDYFEIQPVGNCMHLLRDGQVSATADLININRRIAALGERFKKPVAATCDVHFLEPEDEIYRRIIMSGEGYKDADNQAPLFYRTTEEMLAEFDYLGADKAYEVVVTNTRAIADSIETLKPIPSGTFAPQIEGAQESLQEISRRRAKALYGENLPPLVAERLERELNSIIKNGFAVLYVIAQKLVGKSNEDGYLVGSRGSVGSSFVATMAGITEVNPLPPHYICPACQFSDFDSPEIKAYAGGSGCDMPDRVCPRCGVKLRGEGHDIPFETFLGFDGDKEPDIDLNFSGEYQARAHAYTEELFGEGNVFKAGTIATLADKTAYGYVRKYFEQKNQTPRGAEINRLKLGCTGIKRTTGQHPGGLMILPRGHSIYEFCPVQRPANDVASNVTTTHFDYHSISGRLLKLDLLGHDVPTIIRMLHDITGVDPVEAPLTDKKTLSLFTSPEAMGVSPEEINCKTGTLGLPEFGTTFVRQMLLDTQPSTFAELVRISGLSHGTDVWLNNASDLIRGGQATLSDVIPTRDDIMLYLIQKGVEKKTAFKIMESVRKGKGVKAEEAEIMREAGVPDWYIESCRKIRYLFPKGHAVAYVTMTVRIGYFKLYYPYAFYAATFSVKAEDFDYTICCKGYETARQAMAAIAAQGKEAGAKDKNMLTTLELVLEMYARGLKFVPLDLYKAQTTKFLVTPNGLMPPLCTIQGLGVSVAQSIVQARSEGEFCTVSDFKDRTKINKAVIDLLRKNGVLDGLPETDQMTLW